MSRLKAIWRVLNMPCAEMSRLASESLDRDLDRLERIALQLHLVYCIACRRYRGQLKFLHSAMDKLARSVEHHDCSPGLGLPDAVRQRIKRAIKTN
jgi:hypothetical protein